MHFLSRVFDYLTTGSHWTGTEDILGQLGRHVEISAISVAIAIAIAVPVGLALGHTGRGSFLAISIANVGRALPSLAIIIILATWRLGLFPATVALVLLSIPPMLYNTYTGIAEVDPELKEAASGMGMTGGQVLRHVELPSAIPLIFAGIRTATVQCIATATLAAYVNFGTLGLLIREGLANHSAGNVQVFSGGVLVVALALAAEIGLAALQRAVTPRGLRLQEQAAAEPAPAEDAQLVAAAT